MLDIAVKYRNKAAEVQVHSLGIFTSHKFLGKKPWWQSLVWYLWGKNPQFCTADIYKPFKPPSFIHTRNVSVNNLTHLLETVILAETVILGRKRKKKRALIPCFNRSGSWKADTLRRFLHLFGFHHRWSIPSGQVHALGHHPLPWLCSYGSPLRSGPTGMCVDLISISGLS